MIDHYKIITITHHDLNVNELERFVVKDGDGDNLSKLKEIKQLVGLEEIQYLSTCNRVMYFFYTPKVISDHFLASFLQAINPDFKNDKLSDLKKCIRAFEGQKAIQHFFAVSSSLDSLVIGEREILRQCKESYKANAGVGLTGDHLRLVNEYMIMAAKDVYSNTRIGEKPVSIVSLAIQKLLKSFIKPSDRLLLLGAGETIALVSKFLTKYSYSNISIFNRSIDNAVKLSKQPGANAYHLSELETYAGGFDCIIACTGATQAIVTPTIYESLLRSDKKEKLVIDLAVPNNVDRSIGEKHNVEIIDIENLRELAEENLRFRKTEVGQAEHILSNHVDTFVDIHRQRQIEKSLSNLPEEIKAVKERALYKVYNKQLEVLDEPTKALINDMMGYMEKKCVGIPMKLAKSQQNN